MVSPKDRPGGLETRAVFWPIEPIIYLEGDIVFPARPHPRRGKHDQIGAQYAKKETPHAASTGRTRPRQKTWRGRKRIFRSPVPAECIQPQRI